MLTPFRSPDVRVTITTAARRCGLTQRAIRFYETHGLVTSHRTATGARCYDQKGIDRLNYIAFARRAGLTLRQIGDLLVIGRSEGPEAETHALRVICAANLERLNRQRDELQAAIQTLSAPRRSGLAVSA